MSAGRVGFIIVLLALVASAWPSNGAAAHENIIRVTLLGTGTPTPEPNRAGPAVLVEAGGLVLLFDAGRGVVVRLAQAGVNLSKIDAIFITHLHSDHVVGLPDLLLSSRLPAGYGLRTSPMPLYGPTGSAAMADGIATAFSADIEMREKSQHLSRDSATFDTTEYNDAGLVFEKSGVRVTAFNVGHGEYVKPAFGYRIDSLGHSIVISGDTRFDENLVRAASGADVVIHEVAHILPAYVAKYPQMKKVTEVHTSPQQVGTIFSRVKPKLGVLTHLALIGGATVTELVDATRETYDGPLIVGEDLMTFEIGKGIAVYHRPSDPRPQ